MFEYDVMSKADAEKERYSLLEDGDYNAVVFDCISKISVNSGNPMFEVNLHVYDKNGNKNEVKDFLTFTPKMMWKVINCCESAGVLAEYENKQLNPELLKGKNVKVRIKTQKGNLIPFEKLNGKSEGSCYPDKNTINDYLGKVEHQGSFLMPLKPLPQAKDAFDDQDLPF